MTRESDQTIEGARAWWARKRVVLGAILMVAALVVVVLVFLPRPQNRLGLGGSLKIDTDPGVDVYIGNKHVGTGPVELTWDELLGTPEHRPLATLIYHDAPVPSGESVGAITAEGLGGEGSQIIWTNNVHSASARSLTMASKHVLLRRPQGDLDLITVIDLALTTPTDSGRFLVPIRLRSANDSDEFVCGQPRGWTFHPDIKWITGLVHTSLTPPPDEFAEEIKEKGLWKPNP